MNFAKRLVMIRNIVGRNINLHRNNIIIRNSEIFLEIFDLRYENSIGEKEESKVHFMLAKLQPNTKVMHSTLIVIIAIT